VLVPASSPARTLRDLVELARAQPGTLNYGSFGLGSTPHLEGEMLKELAGCDMMHVPFRGAADAMTALLTDQIQLLITARARRCRISRPASSGRWRCCTNIRRRRCRECRPRRRLASQA
jgi:tripartite-type tricarboxylate transporter receptor subunit TctC